MCVTGKENCGTPGHKINVQTKKGRPASVAPDPTPSWEKTCKICGEDIAKGILKLHIYNSRTFLLSYTRSSNSVFSISDIF